MAGILGAAIPATILWPGAAQTGPISEPDADMALVVAVDTSNSVDDRRYHLQVEGIAKALEDPGVINAITGGAHGGIFFSLVEWLTVPDWIFHGYAYPAPMMLNASPGWSALSPAILATSPAWQL